MKIDADLVREVGDTIPGTVPTKRLAYYLAEQILRRARNHWQTQLAAEAAEPTRHRGTPAEPSDVDTMRQLAADIRAHKGRTAQRVVTQSWADRIEAALPPVEP